MSELKPIESAIPDLDVQEYLKDQFTLAIIQRMRAEPGMEWFSPDSTLPDSEEK